MAITETIKSVCDTLRENNDLPGPNSITIKPLDIYTEFKKTPGENIKEILELFIRNDNNNNSETKEKDIPLLIQKLTSNVIHLCINDFDFSNEQLVKDFLCPALFSSSHFSGVMVVDLSHCLLTTNAIEYIADQICNKEDSFIQALKVHGNTITTQERISLEKKFENSSGVRKKIYLY